MKKRVHYPINREKIAEVIELYKRYTHLADVKPGFYSSSESQILWCRIYDTFRDVCRMSNVEYVGITLLQAMNFSDTLTVDNLYYTLLAAGVNTKLVEVE